jgi:hypothetical protein
MQDGWRANRRSLGLPARMDHLVPEALEQLERGDANLGKKASAANVSTETILRPTEMVRTTDVVIMRT